MTSFGRSLGHVDDADEAAALGGRPAVEPVRGIVMLGVQLGRLERGVVEADHIGVRQNLQAPLIERYEFVYSIVQIKRPESHGSFAKPFVTEQHEQLLVVRAALFGHIE